MEKADKKFETWVRKQVEYYKSYLGLQLLTIEIRKSDTEKYLSIGCRYPYLEPFIWYSKEAVSEWEAGNLTKKEVLHELCHIITDPLYIKATRRCVTTNEIEDERERLTDTICVILNNLTK